MTVSLLNHFLGAVFGRGGQASDFLLPDPGAPKPDARHLSFLRGYFPKYWHYILLVHRIRSVATEVLLQEEL